MHSEYQHLIDLSDYPVSWWKKVVELGEEVGQGLFIPLLAYGLILVEQGLQCPYCIVQQILDDTFVVSFADIGEQMALFVHDILFLNHLLAIQADHMAEQPFQGR